MKTEVILVDYSSNGYFKLFGINGSIGHYPLPYTAQACAEDWCKQAGWNLICVYQEDMLNGAYSIRVEVVT